MPVMTHCPNPMLGSSHDPLDLAREALILLAKADDEGGAALFEIASTMSKPGFTKAMLALDHAGAIEAVYHADWNGKCSWRVRKINSAGRDIARHLGDDTTWRRLKGDLSALADPLVALVKRYSDTFILSAAEVDSYDRINVLKA